MVAAAPREQGECSQVTEVTAPVPRFWAVVTGVAVGTVASICEVLVAGYLGYLAFNSISQLEVLQTVKDMKGELLRRGSL
eukprot:g80407.t1